MVDDTKQHEAANQMTNGDRLEETLKMIVDGRIVMHLQNTRDLAAKLLENPIDNMGSFLAIAEQIFLRQPGLLSELNMRVFTQHMKEAGILEEVMETMKDVLTGNEQAKPEIKH
jgi:hypothetical protein